jgi:spermidine synthase
VVELSPLVLEAATTWFGVINSDMHKLHNDDGIKFIKNAQANGKNI